MNLAQATVTLKVVRDRLVTVKAAEESLIVVLAAVKRELGAVWGAGIEVSGLGEVMATVDDLEVSIRQAIRAADIAANGIKEIIE